MQHRDTQQYEWLLGHMTCYTRFVPTLGPCELTMTYISVPDTPLQVRAVSNTTTRLCPVGFSAKLFTTTWTLAAFTSPSCNRRGRSQPFKVKIATSERTPAILPLAAVSRSRCTVMKPTPFTILRNSPYQGWRQVADDRMGGPLVLTPASEHTPPVGPTSSCQQFLEPRKGYLPMSRLNYASRVSTTSVLPKTGSLFSGTQGD